MKKEINPEVQQIAELLFKTHGGQLRLGKKTTAHILGISVSTLDRNRYTLLPFHQENESSNVMYNVYDIAQFIIDSKIKVS